MSDNRMNFTIENNSQFPFVEIVLDKGEKAYIQRGSMVYHSSSVKLRTKLNAKGSGLGKLVKAVGRSMVSGESTFITEALSDADGGLLALAPNVPGQVMPLYLGEHQYRLNDGAFLALDGSAFYTMERQSIGRALFGGQGGFFVMTTQGEGTLLVNAWSKDLHYDIHLENGFLQSVGTGEGVVNTFRGTGEIYVQSLNVETFAKILGGYIPTKE